MIEDQWIASPLDIDNDSLTSRHPRILSSFRRRFSPGLYSAMTPAALRRFTNKRM
jgi:hypothetical protein